MFMLFTFLVGLSGPAMADGACCTATSAAPTCSVVSAEECTRADGFYFEEDVSCDDVGPDCDGSPAGGDPDPDPDGTSDPLSGACCVDDTCYELSREECADVDGYYYGDGTDCYAEFVECEPPAETGAS